MSFLSKFKKADKEKKPKKNKGKKEKKQSKLDVKNTLNKKNKKALIAIAGVAVITIGAFVIFYMKQPSQESSAKDNLPKEVRTVMEEGEEIVEVLPASERLLKSTDKGYLEDPFEAPMVLVGVLQNRASEDIATVRSGNIVYNVKEGDIIAGIWKVEEIYLDRIYLSSEDREIMLGIER